MNLVRELESRNPEKDAAILSERLSFFRDKEPQSQKRPIEEEHLQPRWPGDTRLPEVDVSNLDVTSLKSAIATAGALIVRGLLHEDEVKHFRDVVDQVVDGCIEQEDEEGNPKSPDGFYRNPPQAIKQLLPFQKLRNSRGFHRQSGSAMCIESASAAEQLLDFYSAKGLKTLIEAYLGQPPCLSALKWVLRRSKLPIAEAGWHQDGAFMGNDINSINMWIPLDTCGGDTGAPGLDVVPRRLSEIVRPGEDSAVFSWSVGGDDIDKTFGTDAVVSPVFQAGDAFFFDHFYLHRTQFREDFSRPRYAIETWFFDSVNFPANQIPLAW